MQLPTFILEVKNGTFPILEFDSCVQMQTCLHAALNLIYAPIYFIH